MVMCPGKDFMIRGVLEELAVRFVFGNFKELAETAILRHDTDPLAGRLLGGAVAAGALLSVLLDENERYTVHLTYPGPVKGIILDISENNGLRGFIQHPHVMTEAETLDAACGSGCTVALTRSADGRILNSGQSESAFIEPEAALGYFFSVSDQIETEIRTGISFRPDPISPLRCAGAVMLQALPDCDLEKFNLMRERLMTPEAAEILAASDMLPEEQLQKLLEYICAQASPAVEAVRVDAPQFVCHCSSGKIWETAKAVLGDEEFEKLLSENPDPVIRCQFCNAEHHLPKL